MASSRSHAEASIHRQITAAIAVGAALDLLLARITRAAVRLCRSDVAMITLLTDGGDELELVSVFGTRAPVLGIRLPVAESLNGLVVTSGRSVRSTDVLYDPRPAVRAVRQMSGARGVLAVPFRNCAWPFGTLGVAKRVPWRFTDRNEASLRQLADGASIAIEHARLRERLQGAVSRSVEQGGLPKDQDHSPAEARSSVEPE